MSEPETAGDGPAATADVHRALECVAEQRTAIAERIAAFESFADRVRDVPAPAGPSAATATPVAQAAPAALTSRASTPAAGDRTAAVRRAFVETVLPHSRVDAEDSIDRALAAELTRDIAVALTRGSTWTPAVKRAVLEAASTRRAEAKRLRAALETEREALEGYVADLEPIVAWLRSAGTESLSAQGFEELRAKHDRLEACCGELTALLETRQERLHEPVREAGDVPYRTLVESVYASVPVRFPVLATAARLYRLCRECQRTVRHHLVRRA